MSTNRLAAAPSPPLVALAGWLLPGAGYLLLGQRARGLVIGTTILFLFVFGLLVAGVRVVEVPGFDSSGKKVMVTPVALNPQTKRVEATGEPPHWVMLISPLNEIRNKPWSVPQALTGPISFAAAAGSVWAAGPVDGDHPRETRGQLSHARINEIGSLYLSIAGLLNLLTIIDASHRAAHRVSAPAAATRATA